MQIKVYHSRGDTDTEVLRETNSQMVDKVQPIELIQHYPSFFLLPPIFTHWHFNYQLIGGHKTLASTLIFGLANSLTSIIKT